MKIVRIAGILLCGVLVRDLHAQRPGSAGITSIARGPVFGRLGFMAGMTYKKYGAYGAQLSGVYYLTPESRALSFRVQGYAAWSPFQSIATRAPASLGLNNVSQISSGTSREIGGGIAAILHARPSSRISPYLIVGYGIAERWQDGAVQSYTAEGQPAGSPLRWPHSYTSGDLSAGAGVRARVGAQIFRIEATSTNNRIAVSLGMSLPF